MQNEIQETAEEVGEEATEQPAPSVVVPAGSSNPGCPCPSEAQNAKE